MEVLLLETIFVVGVYHNIVNNYEDYCLKSDRIEIRTMTSKFVVNSLYAIFYRVGNIYVFIINYKSSIITKFWSPRKLLTVLDHSMRGHHN